jgi:hypothetical protein
MIDLRNSTLNFKLNMPENPATTVIGSKNAPCPNDTVASLFQVISVSVGGQ